MDIRNKSGELLFSLPEGWDPIFEDKDFLVGARLDDADAAVIDLGNANASRCSLAGADLYHAFLNKINLEGANLEGADLRGANLGDARLVNANLRGANLGLSAIKLFVRLEGADLTGAITEGANFEGALYDERTIFPAGFDPREHGMLTGADWDRIMADWKAKRGKE